MIPMNILLAASTIRKNIIQLVWGVTQWYKERTID
jgi:hypothetical protein